MSNPITLPIYAVEIERGKDVCAIEVPAHELNVLRAIHKPDAIRVTSKDAGEAERVPNAYAEFANLQRKYRRNGAPDPVRLAFPDGPAGLEKFGFVVDDAGSEEVAKAPQSRVRDHAKEAKAATAKAKKSVKAE